eukprot:747847-Hanusia_phi.AAC.2
MMTTMMAMAETMMARTMKMMGVAIDLSRGYLPQVSTKLQADGRPTMANEEDDDDELGLDSGPIVYRTRMLKSEVPAYEMIGEEAEKGEGEDEGEIRRAEEGMENEEERKKVGMMEGEENEMDQEEGSQRSGSWKERERMEGTEWDGRDEAEGQHGGDEEERQVGEAASGGGEAFSREGEESEGGGALEGSLEPAEDAPTSSILAAASEVGAGGGNPVEGTKVTSGGGRDNEEGAAGFTDPLAERMVQVGLGEERDRDSKTDRQTIRQAGRQAGRQRDKETERGRDRDTASGRGVSRTWQVWEKLEMTSIERLEMIIKYAEVEYALVLEEAMEAWDQ